MRVLLIDGHPAAARLSATLLDAYLAGLGPTAEVRIVRVRDLAFDPVLRHGKPNDQLLEPQLFAAASDLVWADHLVLAHPLWWGAEPSLLKGFFDRILMPGFAFKYRPGGTSWDRLLAGRSADVLVTLDTPALILRLLYGNASIHRIKKQVLGFVGFAPVRVSLFGPTNTRIAAQKMPRWQSKAAALAKSSQSLRRSARHEPPLPHALN